MERLSSGEAKKRKPEHIDGTVLLGLTYSALVRTVFLVKVRIFHLLLH